MPPLNQDFANFHTNISLSGHRVKRIQDAYSRLRRVSKSDDFLSEIQERPPFLQGSYQHSTAITPTDDQTDFDVDVVFVVSRESAAQADWDVDRLLASMTKALGKHGDYAERITVEERCIRIDYTGQFHLDLVPMIPSSQWPDKLLIPNTKTGDWDLTDPQGLNDWVTETNQSIDENFTRVMKFLKEWRNQNFEPKTRIPSVALTVYAGRHLPKPDRDLRGDRGRLYYQESKSDATLLTDLLLIMNDCVNYTDGPRTILHPTMPEGEKEDLARDWSHSHLKTFRRQVARSSRLAQSALTAEDEETGRNRWKRLLGSRF